MSDPSKKLTPEEQAYMANIRARQERALFGAEIKAFLLILFVIFSVLTLYATQRPPETYPSLPSYADCVRLLSPSVNNLEKLKITSRYFPYRPLCRIKTGYFTVSNVLQKGTSDVELVLSLNRYNMYELDVQQLLNALMPDRESAAALHASAALIDTAQALDDIGNGSIDISRLMQFLSKSGGLSSYVGENAEIVKARLLRLQDDYVLPPEKVLVPGWLDVLVPLKKLRPRNDPRMMAPTPASNTLLTPAGILDFMKKIGTMGQ